ncbi:MAG: hypothetical protein ACF8SC_04025 [Phycisphaerales bacterium JB037]
MNARTTALARTARLTLAAGLCLPASLATLSQAQEDQDLPVTEITLYRSGVGHFLRTGNIEGDATIQLRFKTEQINDILKSMYLLDLGGGKIEGVNYASREPLGKRLASFAVDISDSPDLPTLIERLRGAPLAVETFEGVVRGTVMGVEKRAKVVGETAITVPFVSLLTPGGIKAVDLTAVLSFDIMDEQLARELERALAALAEHRADTVKTVGLGFSGNGTRQVVVGYVHEMPVWKTSYRLILPDDGGGSPLIQGWAIVENTTDEDWEDVELSLVAGQPVGFTMDLYQPLFVPRPEIPVPVLAGIAPQVYAGAMMKAGEAADEAYFSRGGGGRVLESEMMDAAPAPASAMRRGITSSDMFSAGAQAQATAGEMGEVFQYTLDTPVTLERQQSAMLPILSSPIEGERVSIYNASSFGEHPMRGVKLTNTADLQLMPGPLAVFDGTAYAGDAQIGHVSQGDERLISYAVDLDVEASTETSGDSRVQSIRIINGVIEQSSRMESTTKYTFRNKDTRDGRDILVEHAKRGGWDLVTPKEPSEETDAQYRFKVGVGAGKASTLSVTQERIDRQRFEITNYNIESLLAYQRQGRASQAVVDAFREAARLRDLVAQSEQRIEALEQERREIAQDQERIRSNMSRIDQQSELYRRYITKLTEQETRLEQIVGEIEAARAQRQERQRALMDYLRNLTVS